MTMGEYIKELREGKGLSQEELGRMLNPEVNRAAVNKWEKGHVENLKRTTIQQLSKIFGVSPAKLMCFENNEQENIDYTLTKGDLTIPVENLNLKDNRDIARTMSYVLSMLDNQQEALMFDGEALDEESRELLKSSIENSLKIGKVMAKKKFTPTKYKK
jgi:transcriptional regulator with XRE-family HTH domain